MITITKNGNAVKFLFEDSQHYLMGDGEIEVPVNSLSLIIDESEMVTFKKASSDDIFVSFNPADSNLSTKAGVVDFYKNNMVGSTGGGSGSGVTSGEVQTMIDESISGKADSSAVTAEISAAVSGCAEATAVTEEIGEALEDYYTKDEVDAGFSSVTSSVTAINSSLTAHTADTGIHTTTAEKEVWNAKQTALTAGTGIDITNNVISVTASTGGSNVVELTQAQYEALTTKDPDVLYVITDAPEISISGKADTSAVTAVNDALTAHTANTNIHTTAQEKSTWTGKQDALVSGTNIKTINNQSLLGSGNIDIQGGGTDTGTVQTMIEDYFDPKEEVIAASLVDLNGRVEDLETGGTGVTIATAITSSSTNSEAAGALATYNAITAATTGGGATYSAGTNISIDTANTINCTLPITANTSNKNVSVGYSLNVREEGETSIGKFNVNRYVSATAHSGNTIFTVGNGGSNGLRHNALEIRKNGDLYFADTSNDSQSYYQKPMVRLQDMYAALGGLKFVKLTQSEYDQLATKDANTLYIITNVVS